jgi:transcriptional regulator with XRE-family HTH domain
VKINSIGMMNAEVLKKIKKLRKERAISTQEMADRLNIDVTAYTRLEAGNTLTWAKYLEDILVIFGIEPVEFFSGIDTKVKSKNKSVSNPENIPAETPHTKDKTPETKISELYAERLEEKDKLIEKLYNIIDKMNR